MVNCNAAERLENYIDFASEAVWRIASTHQAGLKMEIFNLTDNQEKIINNNVAWCRTRKPGDEKVRGGRHSGLSFVLSGSRIAAADTRATVD